MADRAMPKMTKSPPELVERFGQVLERYPEAVRRQMFGYPAAFVGGNMATSLFQNRWVVRLAEDEIDAAKAAGAEGFEPMAGRPMKGFVVIPPDDVADDTRLAAWVERGLARARAMPPKK
jgi:TfoX/Sxy family transcriptional regulator of competence genes